MNIIEAIKYFIIGIIQGITEVLPVSSSGHVEIFKNVLNLDISDKAYLFLILLNTGSLLTFVIIYFKRLVELIKGFVLFIFVKKDREKNHENFIYMCKILIASIPAGIVGLLFKDKIDEALANYTFLVVGIGLTFTASILFLISQRRLHNKNFKITWLDSLYIGIAQSIAVVPGISRSGMTTSMALERDHGIDSALNFSFLLYIPISFASLGLLVFESYKKGFNVPDNAYYMYYFLAFIGAAIATYIAYKLIFNIFRSGKIRYFAYYCMVIGIGSIIWFIAQ